MEWIKFNDDITQYTYEDKEMLKVFFRKFNKDFSEITNYEEFVKDILDFIVVNLLPYPRNWMPGLLKFLLNICPDKSYKSFMDILVPYFNDKKIGQSIQLFNSNKKLTYIKIPAGIKIISPWSFYECSRLELIEFESSELLEIGAFAFENCSNLRNIKTLKTVNSICESAFNSCVNLSYIEFNNVKNIKNFAFTGCARLQKFKVNSNLRKLGLCSFKWCNDLVDLTLPETLNEISDGVILGCYKLKAVNYLGRKDQWESIKKDPNWNELSNLDIIECRDGNIKLKDA